jgi:Domain of unknown function (DUF4352)
MQATTSDPGTSQRRPRWPRRHPVLTTLAAVTAAFVTGIVLLAALIGSAAQQITQPDHVAPTAAQAATPGPADTGSADCNSSGCGAWSQPAGPQVFALGETATVTQDGQDAANITITSVRTSTQPADQYGEAPQNGYFVIVHVRARALNSYASGFDVNPFDFYARVGGQHFEYDNGNAIEALGMNQNTMDAATLNAGESTSGLIVFDLPRPHGKIAYSPNLDGGPIGFWRF